jgi:hypothetical protein
VELAHLAFCDPEERFKIIYNYEHGINAFRTLQMGLAPAAMILQTPDATRSLLLPGFTEVASGKHIHTEKFWSGDPELRNEIPTEVKKLFRRPGYVLSQALRLEPSVVPQWKAGKDGRVEIALEIQMVVAAKYLVDGTLVVESEPKALDTGESKTWRIVGLHIERGQKMPSGHPPGAMP